MDTVDISVSIINGVQVLTFLSTHVFPTFSSFISSAPLQFVLKHSRASEDVAQFLAPPSDRYSLR